MIYFNQEKLAELLTELAILTGANVSIYDENHKATNVFGNTRNEFCLLISSNIVNGCSLSDKNALEECNKTGESISYHCHFGFVEIMVREQVDNVPIFICVGPFLDENKKRQTLKKMKDLSKLLGKEKQFALHWYDRLPVFTEQKRNAVISLVHVIVEHAKETKIIAIKEDIFESQINPYLLNNLDKKLYIDELSEKFRITQRKLNAIIKKATGLTPKQYITKIKIEKAYNEIVLSNKDLQDISSDIGIEDYNYFIKLFKSIKGHTPKYFRKDS